ncbi:hypothetical protein CVT24_004791 [Panaeolus cyanescens]|uniref:Alpha/beta hydrolase fold-3 domain-containing protein n=1 Tax=Panaeolus cyanescens TaxID=181874 RepID=A0A409VQ12_9AGAR|nr:hypothetical protein CVT24_004791 [Panaeolus cyanescens]
MFSDRNPQLPHYIKPKTEVFFRGWELLDPAAYSKYLYPFREGKLSPIVHSPPIYNPASHPTKPGFPADPRMKLPQLYLQLGEYNDYYTGDHEPSLSAQLREALANEENPDIRADHARKIISQHHHILFPQLNIASNHWPPTLLVHGKADTAVPIAESRNLQRLLRTRNVDVDLIEVDGQEHSFDFRPNAQTDFVDVFDRAVAFMKKHLDIPSNSSNDPSSPLRLGVVPTIVFFHGGGLTAGSKESFILMWLVDRALSLGYAFVSPNYQLIPPATAHEIKQDVLDVFTFLADASFEKDDLKFKVDTNRITVAGSSAGGPCAYLAAASAVPRPKALLSIYAMGGNFLVRCSFSPKYIEPKGPTPGFQRDPKDFEEYTYPYPKGPVAPHTEVVVPLGTLPNNIPKLWLMGYYCQLGTFADYYTGLHEPSISKVLQEKLKDVKGGSKSEIAEALMALIPETQQALFPQIMASRTEDWPPTLLIHGTQDRLVEFEESVFMDDILRERGVISELIAVEGADHAFYYGADAETLSNGDDVLLDVYPPTSLIASEDSSTSSITSIPAVVYFHGGGLIVGNKETFLPTWLMDRVSSLGYAFISPNYQLIPPATGHDIKQDIIDVFSFISKTEFQIKGASRRFKINSERIVVSGSSAGGLCAYLAAAYATPKPKACLSIYGQGGNFLRPFYLQPKLEPFYNNEPLLDPKEFDRYLYPYSKGPLSPETDVLLPFPPDIPPDTSRMELMKLYVQMGTFVDYYTGAHAPSLSQALRSKFDVTDNQGSNEDPLVLETIIPEHHRGIFPQLIAKGAKELQWPPTILIHGSADAIIDIEETRTMHRTLVAADVEVDIAIIMSTESYHITLPYRKTASGDDVLLDVYPPPSVTEASDASPIPKIPALIYFHGGGIVVGNRKSFLPPWIMRRVLSAGWAFISADYHLLTPPTAHDIKHDVIDAFNFVVNTEFEVEGTGDQAGVLKRFGVDGEMLAVSGSSGGGLPAYLAACFAVPKPKAVLGVYGMGGNFLLPFYVKPKTEPFFPGEPLLNVDNYQKFIYPFDTEPLPIETDIFVPSPPPPNWHTRSNLRKLSIQLGNWIDHYTGAHNPSISAVLQSKLVEYADNSKEQTEELEKHIPEEYRHLFPQIYAQDAPGEWPPTVLIHGNADTAVLFEESKYLKDVLEAAGTKVELLVAQGQDHAFDFGPTDEKNWGWMFERAFNFVKRAVEKDRTLSFGYVFISPNYQLMPPATAHDMNKDVLDVFSFITKTQFQTKSEKSGDWKRFRVDRDRIAVAGSSAGGLLAYLAASNAIPRPQVLLSIYGMGGNFLVSALTCLNLQTPFYIQPKTKPFIHDEPLLSSADFEEHLYPYSNGPLAPCSDIPIPSSPSPPPRTHRMKLISLYLQLGVFLDYYTGSHEPSLSKTLQSKMKELIDSNRAAHQPQTAETSDPHADAQGANVTEMLTQLIPEEHRYIFPQLQAEMQAPTGHPTGKMGDHDSSCSSRSLGLASNGWPATVFIHGTEDQNVLFSESTNMRNILLGKGMPKDRIPFLEAEGQDHGFDYAPGVEKVWGRMFDEAVGFMRRVLEK